MLRTSTIIERDVLEFNASISREVDKRQKQDGFACTLVIAASTIVAVRLAGEHIDSPSPRVLSGYERIGLRRPRIGKARLLQFRTVVISVAGVFIFRTLVPRFNVSRFDHWHTGSEVFNRLYPWEDVRTINISCGIWCQGII
jgi:hypothetical protein